MSEETHLFCADGSITGPGGVRKKYSLAAYQWRTKAFCRTGRNLDMGRYAAKVLFTARIPGLAPRALRFVPPRHGSFQRRLPSSGTGSEFSIHPSAYALG